MDLKNKLQTMNNIDEIMLDEQLSNKEILALKIKSIKDKENSNSQEDWKDLLATLDELSQELISYELDEEGKSDKISTTKNKEDKKENKYDNYYKNMDPAKEEEIGLIYGSRTLFGLSLGGLLGILGQIIYNKQVVGSVLVIMIVIGTLMGVSLGMAENAKLSRKD